jgi:hypothetical protein
MHRALIAAACATCLSVAAGAQAPSQGTPGPAGASAGARGPAPSADVVMTGCVERADQLAPAGGSAIGNTVDSLDFVLTNAQLADSPHPVTPAPTGTSGTASAAGTDNGIGSMYKLDGPLDTMNPQVGHRVEITGTREPSGTGATPPSANAVNPSAANAPTIKVTSIRMLTETCAR